MALLPRPITRFGCMSESVEAAVVHQDTIENQIRVDCRMLEEPRQPHGWIMRDLRSPAETYLFGQEILPV